MNNTTSDPVKIDLEQLLREGNIIRIKPQGYSMYPLFIPGRDEALIQQTDGTDCHRNDVVLYRRDQGILVLHRICRTQAYMQVWKAGRLKVAKWKVLCVRIRLSEN